MPQPQVQHPKINECDGSNAHGHPTDMDTLRQRERPFGIVERIRDFVLKKHPFRSSPSSPHQFPNNSVGVAASPVPGGFTTTVGVSAKTRPSSAVSPLPPAKPFRIRAQKSLPQRFGRSN